MAQIFDIIVVEDDANDVILLQRAFAKAGINHPLRFLRDGQEAIDLLSRAGAFDPCQTMLVLDLKMPRVTGFQVLEWLQAHPGLGKLVVVVFTSSDDTEDMRRATELGADLYLVKPMDADEFIHVVRQLQVLWAAHHSPDALEIPGAIPPGLRPVAAIAA